jgi:ubiquinone/menaquinone biosynthesis C-methylase UbiE
VAWSRAQPLDGSVTALDYDQSGIATTYDEARALTPARRQHWQRLLSAHVDRTAISLIVDLGCGTGRFSEMLAAEFSARVIGLDPSEKMIDQARRKSATTPVVIGRAAADELPLPDGCIDLVFMSQRHRQVVGCWIVKGAMDRSTVVGRRDHAAMATPATSAQVANAWRRAE